MIYIAGSLNMDLRIEAPYMPVAGETITGGGFLANGGGKGANQACAFGSKAASIACTRAGAQQSVPTREETENY